MSWRAAPADGSEGFRLRFQLQEGCLCVHASGEVATLQALIGLFAGIGEELQRTRAGALLILDATRSVIPDDGGFEALAAAMAAHGFDRVRTAFVDVAGSAMAQIEIGEIIAQRHGYALRIFDDERSARIWLRYGRE